MAARKLVLLVFITTVLAAIGIGVNVLAFVTPKWVQGEFESQGSQGKIHHGLSKGVKSLDVGGTLRSWDIRVTCLTGENICMFSCGKSKESREKDLENLYSGLEADDTICDDTRGASPGAFKQISPRADTRAKSIFLNFGLRLMTMVFLSLSTISLILAALLSLLNCFSAPSQPLLSVYGLFIWNGIGAVCQFFAMLLWGIAFAITLKTKPVVSQVIAYGLDSSTISLGYSYWILILTLILALVNLGVLKARSVIIYKRETKVRVVHSTTTSPDQLLF